MKALARTSVGLVAFGSLVVAPGEPALAQAPAAAPPPASGAVRECDELAGIGDPREPETREVWFETIDAGRAGPACKQAVAVMAAHPRYMTQYARALIMAEEDSEALVWYRKAADLGYPRAQAGVGLIYALGRGVPKDPTEAIRWYRLAADQGDPWGQSNLGWMYANGIGVTKDEAEAVRLLRLAADQDNGIGQNLLGVMYLNGRGVPRDEAEAARWYRKAAEEAARLYRLAADQGNASAQNNLGWMYEEGRGVPQDGEEAQRLYRLAVKQGNEKAKQNLTRYCGLKPENCPL